MKNEKIIIITLKVEDNNEKYITDEFIKHDLKQEISCCTNYYEIIDFTIKEINKGGRRDEILRSLTGRRIGE